MEELGYIVLPAAHGKSYHHGTLPGLLEADQIINCNGTPELQEARKEAKSTADWSKYDALWATLIRERIPKGRQVIMVPSSTIGVLLNATCLGSAILTDDVWSVTLAKRGKRLTDYQWGYDPVKPNKTFHDLATLSSWIHEITGAWMIHKKVI